MENEKNLVLDYEVSGKDVEKIEIHYRKKLSIPDSYSWAMVVTNSVVTKSGEYMPYVRQVAEIITSVHLYTDYFESDKNHNEDSLMILIDKSNLMDMLDLHCDKEQRREMIDWTDDMIDREKNVSYMDRAARGIVSLVEDLQGLVKNITESQAIEKLIESGFLEEAMKMISTPDGVETFGSIVKGFIKGLMPINNDVEDIRV